MTIHGYVKKRPFLFWDIRNLEALSEESILEHVLNYGDFDDVRKLFAILSLTRAAHIFRKQIRKKRNNYRPEIKNYFTLYFNKYA